MHGRQFKDSGRGDRWVAAISAIRRMLSDLDSTGTPVWKRFMGRLLKETRVQEHFAERDIRAKVGSDAETLEEARHILGNATVQSRPIGGACSARGRVGPGHGIRER